MASGWQFIPSSEIPAIPWDAMLARCCNETPFASTHWLNRVSPGWGALLHEELELMMPLPFKSKYFLRYIAQPAFTQQLGIFGPHPPSPLLVKEAMQHLPRGLAKVHLQLNTANYSPALGWASKPTYCLSLDADAGTLVSRMHAHHRRNLQQAQQHPMHVVSSADPVDFIARFKSTTGSKDASLTAYHYRLMHDLMQSALQNTSGKILLCTGTDGQVTAGLFYLESATRLINLFNFSTDEGRQLRSMYLLIHQWIMMHAGSPRVIDFEGSSIPSIASFYERFGAEKYLYPVFTRKGFW